MSDSKCPKCGAEFDPKSMYSRYGAEGWECGSYTEPGMALIEGEECLRRQNARLRGLFAKRVESDERTVLDDLRVAATLLSSRCGEIGFGLAQNITGFVEAAEGATGKKP